MTPFKDGTHGFSIESCASFRDHFSSIFPVAICLRLNCVPNCEPAPTHASLCPSPYALADGANLDVAWPSTTTGGLGCYLDAAACSCSQAANGKGVLGQTTGYPSGGDVAAAEREATNLIPISLSRWWRRSAGWRFCGSPASLHQRRKGTGLSGSEYTHQLWSGGLSGSGSPHPHHERESMEAGVCGDSSRSMQVAACQEEQMILAWPSKAWGDAFQARSCAARPACHE